MLQMPRHFFPLHLIARSKTKTLNFFKNLIQTSEPFSSDKSLLASKFKTSVDKLLLVNGFKSALKQKITNNPKIQKQTQVA